MSKRKRELKTLAGKACIALYFQLSHADMLKQSKAIKEAWSIGGELYIDHREDEVIGKTK